MSDFWVSSGHHLVDRDADGRLIVTDDLLKAYIARPEVLPPPEACLVERALHQRLLRNPREPIEIDEINAMQDRDARENWRHLIAFRDHLLAHASLEAAYVALVVGTKVVTPPVFLNQLVHIILRNILDGETDPFVLRAAELFFRPQRLSYNDGVLLLADEETVDGAKTHNQSHTPVSPLVAMFGDARAHSLDVLTAENAAAYHGRSDAFDMVLDFRSESPGRAAFARVLTQWIKALIGVDAEIRPVARVHDESWAWFVGLDQEATRIGNALWRGEEPPDDGRDRIVALFDLRFADSQLMLDKVAGRPVSLILAMPPDRIVRLKPQNILVGLPLKVS